MRLSELSRVVAEVLALYRFVRVYLIVREVPWRPIPFSKLLAIEVRQCPPFSEPLRDLMTESCAALSTCR